MTKFDIIFTILILIIFGFIGCYFVKTNQNLRVLQNELSYLKNESLVAKVSDSTLDQTFSTLNEQFWLKEQNNRLLEKKINALKYSHEKVTQITNTPIYLIDTTGILDSLSAFTE